MNERALHAVAYVEHPNSRKDNMFMYGGFTNNPQTFFNDSWMMDVNIQGKKKNMRQMDFRVRIQMRYAIWWLTFISNRR